MGVFSKITLLQICCIIVAYIAEVKICRPMVKTTFEVNMYTDITIAQSIRQ